MLEWIGDVGGLFDGLSTIGGLLMGRFALLGMKSMLLATLFT